MCWKVPMMMHVVVEQGPELGLEGLAHWPFTCDLGSCPVPILCLRYHLC